MTSSIQSVFKINVGCFFPFSSGKEFLYFKIAYISKCAFCVFIPEQKFEFWDKLNWKKS